MIDIWEVNGRVMVYRCPDCEKEKGCPMRFSWAPEQDMRGVKRFMNVHERCGEERPEMWTQEEAEKALRSVAIMRQIYVEHPGIKFEEAKEIYRTLTEEFCLLAIP